MEQFVGVKVCCSVLLKVVRVQAAVRSFSFWVFPHNCSSPSLKKEQKPGLHWRLPSHSTAREVVASSGLARLSRTGYGRHHRAGLETPLIYR